MKNLPPTVTPLWSKCVYCKSKRLETKVEETYIQVKCKKCGSFCSTRRKDAMKRSTKKTPDEDLKQLRKKAKERITKACLAGKGVRLSPAETRALYPHHAGPR